MPIHTAKVERKSQDENELYVRGPAQKALLEEFRPSLTQAQTGEMYGKLREDYPDCQNIGATCQKVSQGYTRSPAISEPH